MELGSKQDCLHCFTMIRNDFVMDFFGKYANITVLKGFQHSHGGVKVSTGVWKPAKRAEVGPVFVKKDPFKKKR